MRTLLVVALLVLCGCSKNRDQLRAIRDRMEAQLAERKELANNLSERRKELDALEQQLADAADAGIKLEEAPAAPAEPAPAPTPLPPPELPPASIWEGTESERLRAQIVELHQRIAELDKVIGEMNKLDAHKRELQRKLDRVKAIRRATDQTNEGY